MTNSRCVLFLSLAACFALAACGGGSSAESGTSGGGLGSQDTLSITSVSPFSVPATSALPISVEVTFNVDLETASSGVVTAGYQVTSGQVVSTASSQAVTKGAGSGTLDFVLPASALSSTALGVAVTLTDASSGAVLSQQVKLVPRTQ